MSGWYQYEARVTDPTCYKSECLRLGTHTVTRPPDRHEPIGWRLPFCTEHTDGYRRHQETSPHYGYTFEAIDAWERAAERLSRAVGS